MAGSIAPLAAPVQQEPQIFDRLGGAFMTPCSRRMLANSWAARGAVSHSETASLTSGQRSFMKSDARVSTPPAARIIIGMPPDVSMPPMPENIAAELRASRNSFW